MGASHCEKEERGRRKGGRGRRNWRGRRRGRREKRRERGRGRRKRQRRGRGRGKRRGGEGEEEGGGGGSANLSLTLGSLSLHLLFPVLEFLFHSPLPTLSSCSNFRQPFPSPCRGPPDPHPCKTLSKIAPLTFPSPIFMALNLAVDSST